MNKLIYFCAGGTGGHINAALSLGEYFEGHGLEVGYFTGRRYLDYQLFKGREDKVIHLDSQPLRFKNPLLFTKNALLNGFVFLTVIFKFLLKRPVAVFGAGGYVCGPVLLAAKLLFIRIYILEQNAVVGMTNRLLAKIANITFLNFETTKGVPEGARKVVSGNPVRSDIKRVAPNFDGTANILVFGGSLGAEQINRAVRTLAREDWEKPIRFIHQTGRGNAADVTPGKNVIYEQKEYLENMGELLAWSHIVVARAGASTISELRIAGRPSILIPYPFATDNHQRLNAQELAMEKIFYVKVVDQDASDEEIAKQTRSGILEVMEKNLFNPAGECAIVDPCEIIYREIARDVRN